MATALLKRRNLVAQIINNSAIKRSIYKTNGNGSGCHQKVKYHNFGWSNLLFRKPGIKGVGFHVPQLGVGSSFGSTASASEKFSRIGFVSWYLGRIKARPVLTKTITCSLIYIAADFTSQRISLPSDEPYDYVRTLRMAGFGMFILGPSLHFWFNFLSHILPGRDLPTTVKKMILGQTLYGPLMTVIFYSGNAALQGEQYAEIVARLKRDVLPTMLNGLMYWPICDFITFKFVPVHLQPLATNSFSYLWTVYITYMASREKASTT